MLEIIKIYFPKRRLEDLYNLIMDFLKKCNDDHISAFGAMSAFFILLSLLPFMIFFLTLAKYLPFTKDDILHILMDFLSFEKDSLIIGFVNELYHKTATSVVTVSIAAALWSSSKGVYSIVKGLNSVYDIDDTRNYFVLRVFSLFYTVLLAIVLSAMLILWVFGNKLYMYISARLPFMATLVSLFIHRGTVLTFIVLVIIFMLTYRFIPGRDHHFLKQYPGAIIASLGWIFVSKLCAVYMDNFSNFTYVYGSLAGIMILLIWMYFCMSMIFYGAEINYFLENKHNYHTLIRILRPNFKELRRQKEEEMKAIQADKEKNRKNLKDQFDEKFKRKK